MQNALVVDDHPFIRSSVRMILLQEGFLNIRDTSNGMEAVLLAQEHPFDLVILDIALPQLDGLSVITQLLEQQPACRILMLTSQPVDYFSLRCMKAGAAGFVSKSGNLNELSKAIAAIQTGYTYFPNLNLSNDLNSDLISSETERIARLSDRELTVLQQLARGFSNKEIGESMQLSNKTISTYKTRLIKKLKVGTLIDLADLARRNQLI